MGDGVLTIRGKKRFDVEKKERAFGERYYGCFESRIPLAWAIDEDKVSASFKNGVLTVMLPKAAKSSPSVKRIAVNSGNTTKH